MFTGLVQAVGAVCARTAVGDELRLDVDVRGLGGAFRLGDSIALSGVCCTVIDLRDGVAGFHLSRETLVRTWLGAAKVGDQVNLEGALRAGEPLGGHLVQGHVDGVGRVVGAIDRHDGGDLWAEVPSALRRYCVEKGSITLDGVSLTIAALDGDKLRIAIIPHTAQVTTLGSKRPGDLVHVEVDVIAKYVENMLAARFGSAG
ncbi:MAG: riboflavin synthase [Planctomycetes bacterium]|nr:riboflavin synthase [Planctomycetota bacterium]